MNTKSSLNHDLIYTEKNLKAVFQLSSQQKKL